MTLSQMRIARAMIVRVSVKRGLKSGIAWPAEVNGEGRIVQRCAGAAGPAMTSFKREIQPKIRIPPDGVTVRACENS